MISSPVTVVTCYYKIPSKTTSKTFVDWIRNFLQLKCSVVLFTDSHTLETVLNPVLEDKQCQIKVCVLELVDLKMFNYLSYWEYCKTIDSEANHSKELYMLWAEKSWFVQKAIDINEYQSQWFCWADIGCCRSSAEMVYLQSFPNASKITALPIDKMTMIEIRSFEQQDREIDNTTGLPRLYMNNDLGLPPGSGLVRIQGGFFVANISVWARWLQSYEEMLSLFIKSQSFGGKDQAIMSSIALTSPNFVNIIRARDFVEISETRISVDEWFWFRFAFS